MGINADISGYARAVSGLQGSLVSFLCSFGTLTPLLPPSLKQLRSMWSEVPSSYSDQHNLLYSSLRSTPACRPYGRGTRLAIPNCASRGRMMRVQCQRKSKPRPVCGDRAPCSQGFRGIGSQGKVCTCLYSNLV